MISDENEDKILENNGFVLLPKLGLTFRGVDLSSIQSQKDALLSQKVDLSKIPTPEITSIQVLSDGRISIKFN